MTLLQSVIVLLFASLLSSAEGFLQPQIHRAPAAVGAAYPTTCFMSSDDDGADDESIDPNSLGDWRAFRMNLANAGLSSSSPASSVVDGIDVESTEAPAAPVATSTTQPVRPKSVSKKNEELLNRQNAELADEYLNGAWAHESAIAEVGGLVCRLPLEAEIYRGSADSAMHQLLHSFLESDDYDRTEGPPPNSLSSAASTGGAASASVNASSGGTISRSAEDSAIEEEDPNSLFSPLAAKTAFWYRGAENLLKQELLKITSNANPNGRIEPSDLGDDSLELLKMYMDHQQTWQEVCLVVEKDERTGQAKTVTINRPMAFKLSESMGRLVLFGAYQYEKGGGAFNRKEGDGVETQNLVKFLSAFEQECGVYVGGPDDMDKPAVMVHGIADLPGAVEISPGTGIYKGGIDAAMDGVLAGKYKPLDFRFFIGHTAYDGGELDEAVRLGKYQPVACSRPLVLKQCIQLPKPLWHEVLEFCGGELKEISKLEFSKRQDLQ